MTNNINEIFTTYVNAITDTFNQQAQALQEAFQQALQAHQQATAHQETTQPVEQPQVNQEDMVEELVHQQIADMMPEPMKQAEVYVEKVDQVPEPVEPPQPVVEDQVHHAEFIPGNKLEHLSITIQKPCASCSFKDRCSLKGSQISTECEVDEMKQAAMKGGEFHIKVSVADNYKFQFKVYKDGLFIGNVATSTVQSKPIVAELEKHINRTVVVLAHPKNLNSTAHSTFTNFDVEVLNVIDDIPATAPVMNATPATPEPIKEESSSLLGDMVLPFQL